VGTSTPTEKLHVVGDGRVTGEFINGAVGSNGTITLRRSSDGATASVFQTFGNATTISDRGGNGGYITTSVGSTCIRWLGTNSTPRISVGFGDGTIDATLHVRGIGATTTTSNFLVFNSASTELFRIRDNGAVLIGTTTDAGYKLDVNGTARVQNTLTVTKSGSNNYYTFEPSATGTAPYLQAVYQGAVDARIYFGPSSINFRAANSTSPYGIDCASITSNGNIFVGGGKIELASSTNNFLQFTDLGAINIGVIGTADATSYIQVRTGNATNMSTGTLSTTFFNSGNVGIGGLTTDAGYKLDVNGTARVSGNLTATNFILGASSRFKFSLSQAYTTIYAEANNIVEFVQTGAFSNFQFNVTTGRLGITSNIASANSFNASAQLQVDSTTAGFLPPRMTQAQRTAIASPAVGLIVYCTDATEGLWIYKSSGWTFIV
jgi:hypothetical protein